MGWTYTHKPTGTKVRDFLRKRFEQNYEPGVSTGFAVLHDTATFREYFAILERTDRDNGRIERFCLVVFLHYTRDFHNFGFKEVEESAGPYAVPPRNFFHTLEALIPQPDGQHSAAWRERCRAAYEHIDRTNQLAPGQMIQLFGHRYRLIENLARRGFTADRIPFGSRYRITKSQLRNAVLLDAATVMVDV